MDQKYVDFVNHRIEACLSRKQKEEVIVKAYLDYEFQDDSEIENSEEYKREAEIVFWASLEKASDAELSEMFQAMLNGKYVGL